MRASGHFAKTSGKWKQVERTAWVCELCGGECELDRESGEYRCPVCDNPE